MKYRGRSSGITLIEILVAIAVFAVLATVAAPALEQFLLKARLRGGAEALWSDLIYARSESVLRNRMITVSIATGADWCYGLNVGSGCDCAAEASCTVKTVSASAFPGTELISEFTTLSFDSTQGTITGTDGAIGTDTVLLENSLGRAGVKPLPLSVKLCSPVTGGAPLGYPSC